MLPRSQSRSSVVSCIARDVAVPKLSYSVLKNRGQHPTARLRKEFNMQQQKSSSYEIPSPDGSSSVRTFIVPTDFSRPSVRALRWAMALARGRKARIVAIHAIEPTPLGDAEIVEHLLEQSALDRLRWACDECVREGIEVEQRCAVGRPWTVITDEVSKTANPFIVMGNRGVSPIKRLFLGSVADRVQRAVSCPVLVVHEDDDPPRQIRVVIALDFHADAEEAMSTVLEVVGSGLVEANEPANGVRGMHVELIHILAQAQFLEGTDVPVVYSPDWGAMETEAHQRLESIARDLRARGIEVGISVGRGDAARRIIDAARATRADLLVLGRRSAGALARVLLGSTAELVLHRAPCAVLTVRASPVAAVPEQKLTVMSGGTRPVFVT
jgi:nucleotide-binding universal stress UspA family protein